MLVLIFFYGWLHPLWANCSDYSLTNRPHATFSFLNKGAVVDEGGLIVGSPATKNKGDLVAPLPKFVPPLPKLELSVISALPSYLVLSDGIKMDCVYVNAYDYYEIWENTKLNPYGFDGLSLSDTLFLSLTDSSSNHILSPIMDYSVVTSDFGLRRAQWHYGTDLRIKTGEPVYSPFDGVVRITLYQKGGFGRYVVIRHKNGLETIYGHLSKILVAVGDEVKAGDQIGLGGNSGRSTAPHLHFEIRYKGNAINPNYLYDFTNNTFRDTVYTIKPSDFEYLREARAIRIHTIRSGDTLSGLSVRYGVSVSKLCALNGISRKSILRIGQKIRIN